MVNFFLSIVFVVVAIFTISFTLTNQQAVVIGLWPFSIQFEMPLFLPILLFLVFGFLCGFLYKSIVRFLSKS